MSIENKQVLMDKLLITAKEFRLGKEGQASESLRECIDLLMPMMMQLPPTETTLYLSTILDAQERHDWLSVADGLEYELLSLIAEQP
jgi:hypothetical protein